MINEYNKDELFNKFIDRNIFYNDIIHKFLNQNIIILNYFLNNIYINNDKFINLNNININNDYIFIIKSNITNILDKFNTKGLDLKFEILNSQFINYLENMNDKIELKIKKKIKKKDDMLIFLTNYLKDIYLELSNNINNLVIILNDILKFKEFPIENFIIYKLKNKNFVSNINTIINNQTKNINNIKLLSNNILELIKYIDNISKTYFYKSYFKINSNTLKSLI